MQKSKNIIIEILILLTFSVSTNIFLLSKSVKSSKSEAKPKEDNQKSSNKPIDGSEIQICEKFPNGSQITRDEILAENFPLSCIQYIF